MNSILDKLNLRPQERRLVVIVGLVVFIVLNIWMVWPQFGQVGFWENRKAGAEKELKKFKDELNRKSEYEKELKRIELLGGYVASEEQALRLMEEVRTEAALANVTVTRWDPTPRGISSRTNSFFEEQSLVISVNTGEKELVDFLYNLASKNSLIRVKSMSLQPDPTKMRLQGTITLVESFQKKARPTAVATTAASKPAVPAAKPTSAPPKAATQPFPATNTAVKTNAPRKITPSPIPPRKT
jgi:hypothetical protein